MFYNLFEKKWYDCNNHVIIIHVIILLGYFCNSNNEIMSIIDMSTYYTTWEKCNKYTLCNNFREIFYFIFIYYIRVNVFLENLRFPVSTVAISGGRGEMTHLPPILPPLLSITVLSTTMLNNRYTVECRLRYYIIFYGISQVRPCYTLTINIKKRM